MHKALYRVYRPKNFSNVIGQEHIVRTLKNQIENNNVGHAYLFCGTRGTGKTSTAKIFSRAVNCTNLHNDEPCNECENCREILEDKTMDVVEIDAASNNSVDDIRELRENVKYSPAKAKYKVYIIDEVHMLSQGAFNALLKTLEEPPSYVIFILATTEPHKIPATILSRCQRFDFKRVTVKDISSRMRYICEKEGIEADEKALNLIARNSQGALRDALSILDQCISFEGNKISYNDVIELLGSVNIEQLFDLAESIIKEDTRKSLQILNDFIIWGKDVRNLVNDLIDHFRNLMVCKISNDLDEIISLPEETIDLLKQQAETIDTNNLIRILNILSEAQDGMKISSNPRVLMEVTMMKIAQPMFDESKEALIKRIENLEQKIESGNIKVNHISTNQTVDNFNENNQQNNNTVEKQEDENIEYENLKGDDIKLVEKSWKKILQKMKEDKNQVIRALLQDVDSFNISEDTLYIIFTDNYSFAKSRLDSPATIQYVEKVIREVLNRSFSVKIALKSQLSNLNTQIKKEDKGEQILKNIVSEDILEVKDSIEKR
ncbi:DNA polymerase III subunit gamma/tau [Intestinibacter bartlettii]|uniref:DNA-directed DNA polymerase n=1 Tax=Intestinibacter bartlettii TaxID=261299 RepID=A0ABS8D108_9FIRM|nr:DNA polymerase III subunit gamma/tau [Intestinibacter bartlettii]MCB5398604.1 DNA polymerase III subunit gamma/tau [Intestinibacter bartlettii]MCB5405153.1 DNA polymerase III subunit gamma/tau [Intestinibacter bartlettii]MCB5447414.1 DNA polymerase III subunit gamma/tau [Intestinibacter bartlettii]MCB5750207.1 DNA polymerase III subunit gamma/tau [Intestinibacter bartlettii]